MFVSCDLVLVLVQTDENISSQKLKIFQRGKYSNCSVLHTETLKAFLQLTYLYFIYPGLDMTLFSNQ